MRIAPAVLEKVNSSGWPRQRSVYGSGFEFSSPFADG